MSRTISEPRGQSPRRSGTMRTLTMHELLGKSGRERFVERKKEPITVEFAHCAICNESASEDFVRGQGAVRAFAAHHRIKHSTPLSRAAEAINRFFDAHPQIRDWREAARRIEASPEMAGVR